MTQCNDKDPYKEAVSSSRERKDERMGTEA